MKALFKETISILREKEYNWIPSSLAFYMLFSIIPLILAISLITINYMSKDTIDLAQYFSDTKVFENFVDFTVYIEKNFSNITFVALIFLLLYAIYLSSNGVYGLSKAIDKLYGFKTGIFFKERALAYITTIIIIISILGMLLFASVLPFILNMLHIESSFVQSYIILPIILYVALHLIYMFVSGFKLRSKQIYKGALFTTLAIYIVLMLANVLFYNSRINVIFGSLAIIILLTHMFYYISYCIYIGLLINVADDRLSKSKSE